MKSSENHYSFIGSGRNGSLLLIFNILGIEPSSYFIFRKVEGRYWGTVIELKRGFSKNKTLQMSHMIKRTHPLTLMSERSRTFHHQSVWAWFALLYSAFTQPEHSQRWHFDWGNGTVEADATRFWFCYRLDFLSAVVCPHVLWVFSITFDGEPFQDFILIFWTSLQKLVNL